LTDSGGPTEYYAISGYGGSEQWVTVTGGLEELRDHRAPSYGDHLDSLKLTLLANYGTNLKDRL
jgi:hypothetical protein